MALSQADPLNGTTEPLSSVPGRSDRYAQLLTEDNLEIISNLENTRVCTLCIIISLSYIKKISCKLIIINSGVNYFKAARMIQNKKGAQQ